MIKFTENSQMNAKQLDNRLLAMCRKEKLGEGVEMAAEKERNDATQTVYFCSLT